MSIRQRAGLAVLALSTLPALPSGVAAQTVDDAPTNCCVEVYWAGWELGQLESVAASPDPDHQTAAGRHLRRLSATLQAANQTCCQFCEAWSEWEKAREEIEAAAAGPGPLQAWAEGRSDRLLGGLNRCDLEDDSPCKWLDLVDCARAYFQLGVHLGRAASSLSAAAGGVATASAGGRDARRHGLESLDKAADLLGALHADGRGEVSTGQPLRCDYLWEAETGARRLLSEAVQDPQAHGDAHLAGTVAEAHGIILGLLLEGRPDLGISPCPIGTTHGHADCQWAAEHGHAVPEGPGH